MGKTQRRIERYICIHTTIKQKKEENNRERYRCMWTDRSINRDEDCVTFRHIDIICIRDIWIYAKDISIHAERDRQRYRNSEPERGKDRAEKETEIMT